MITKIIKELGHDEALLGLSLSHNSDINNMPDRALKLATKDGGHNKFLESICVWLDITAPRYFWQEFDTYRVGVTKQSESTMHTILNRDLTLKDFELMSDCQIFLNSIVKSINAIRISDIPQSEKMVIIKSILPESYLQRRIVCTNYKALRNIYHQRKNHKLAQWREFCDTLLIGLKYPAYICGNNKKLGSK